MLQLQLALDQMLVGGRFEHVSHGKHQAMQRRIEQTHLLVQLSHFAITTKDEPNVLVHFDTQRIFVMLVPRFLPYQNRPVYVQLNAEQFARTRVELGLQVVLRTANEYVKSRRRALQTVQLALLIQLVHVMKCFAVRAEIVRNVVDKVQALNRLA